jgi:hypothetical protein
MRTLALSLIVSTALSAALCEAQIAPVVGKQRIVRDVTDPEGKLVSHSVTLRKYLRNSAGSTITQTYSAQGGEAEILSGQFEDYSRRKIYQLNYGNHEAVELADLPSGPHPEYLAGTKSALGEETVNGFPCLIHPTYLISDGTKRLIGKAYDSARYGLHIKEDNTFEFSGTRTHEIVELYDIQFVEPDPKEFELEGFSFKGKGPAACTKPGASASAELLK